LDNYIGSTGKRYKDHYRTLRIWLKKDYNNLRQQPDYRDKEIALQQWIAEGNNPDEFNWN